MLQVLKPDEICFSYDSFHRRYVPENNFFKAFAAASKLGIECIIFVSDMKDKYSAGQFIQSLGNNKFGKDYTIYPAYRVGRAIGMAEEMFLTNNERENLGCLYENTLSVFYNGDVYPCCRYQVLYFYMKLGNVKKNSLKEILKTSDVPMICDILMKSDRFNNLLRIAEEQGIRISKKAGCSCDYCSMLFRTETNKRKMLPFVKEMYDQILLNSLLKGENSDVQKVGNSYN